jgi:hypothetical protein
VKPCAFTGWHAPETHLNPAAQVVVHDARQNRDVPVEIAATHVSLPEQSPAPAQGPLSVAGAAAAAG